MNIQIRGNALHDHGARDHRKHRTSSHMEDCQDDVDEDRGLTSSYLRTPTLREVREIIDIPDPVIRNLRITLSYHEIMVTMSELIGTKNVTWPAFATWASRSAGPYIRGEYLSQYMQDYLDKLGYLREVLRIAHRFLTNLHREQPSSDSILAGAVERVIGQITANVAWGNTLVYRDVAPPYAAMIETFQDATSYDEQALNRFLSTFKSGHVLDDGEDLLIAAFRNYYKAMFADDPKVKAEFVLLGNNQVGLHEQTRLQEAITNSLNAPIAELIADAAQDRTSELMPARIQRPVGKVVGRAVRQFSSRLQREWHSLATNLFLSISVPDGDLKVRDDLPPRCEHRMFPAELTELENDELVRLLDELDRTPNTLDGSAAQNWAVLADRMNYIVDFFRVRQQDQGLYKRPFTVEQIEVIRANQVPDGDI